MPGTVVPSTVPAARRMMWGGGASPSVIVSERSDNEPFRGRCLGVGDIFASGEGSAWFLAEGTSLGNSVPEKMMG